MRILFLDISFSTTELGALYADYRGTDYVALGAYEPGMRGDTPWASIPSIGHIKDVEEVLAPHLRIRTRILEWGGTTGRQQRRSPAGVRFVSLRYQR